MILDTNISFPQIILSNISRNETESYYKHSMLIYVLSCLKNYLHKCPFPVRRSSPSFHPLSILPLCRRRFRLLRFLSWRVLLRSVYRHLWFSPRVWSSRLPRWSIQLPYKPRLQWGNGRICRGKQPQKANRPLRLFTMGFQKTSLEI